MSRFELGGKGDPIPLIALPDPNLDENLPPQVFLLSDGVPFNKFDWVGLGYTHYEVWCIGGSGGRGAPGSNQVIWRATRTRPVMTSAEWSNYLALMHYYNDPLGVVYTKWDPTPRPGAPNGGVVVISMDEYYEIQFPQHNPWYRSTYFAAILQDYGLAGGGGGGGGVAVASGLLADLDLETDVVVGAAGADAPVGQYTVNGTWHPVPYEIGGGTTLQQWANDWMNDYPVPIPGFAPAAAGQDGGASSFGGDICQASGGKGGKPYYLWNGSAFVRNGNGGDGGIGGQLTAGGGAAGSAADGVNGADGSWDGTIGAGGGGGHAARPGVPAGDFGFPPAVPYIPATAGGRGAFSYADTSIFGDRQPAVPAQIHYQTFDYYTGAPAIDRIDIGTGAGWAGGGGGARALRTKNYGSDAPTFNPNGLVLVRLTAVL